MPESEGRSGFAAVGVNESIYIFGGVGDTTCDVNMINVFHLNIKTQEWKPVTKMPESRHDLAATSLVDGILVLGGCSSDYLPMDTTWLYIPHSNTWVSETRMLSPRCQFAAVTIEDTVYAIGGYSHTAQDSTTASVEAYSAVTKKWRLIKNMNIPRFGHGAVTYNGKIIVAGGAHNSTIVHEIEMYDPATNQWTILSAMNKPRIDIAMAIVQSSIFMMGGTSDWKGTSLTDVEVYHVDSNIAEIAKPMEGARYDLGSAAVGKTVYAIGGIHTIFASSQAKEEPFSTTICDNLVEVFTV